MENTVRAALIGFGGMGRENPLQTAWTACWRYGLPTESMFPAGKSISYRCLWRSSGIWTDCTAVSRQSGLEAAIQL